MRLYNLYNFIVVAVCSVLVAASIYAMPVLAAHGKIKEQKLQSIVHIQATADKTNTNTIRSSGITITTTTNRTQKNSTTTPVSASQVFPTSAAIASAATSSASARVQQKTSTAPAPSQPPVTTSEGVNLYRGAGGLSPLQTVQFLLLAFVLGVLGVLFAEGKTLTHLYRWFANTVGVKAPLQSVRSRHV